MTSKSCSLAPTACLPAMMPVVAGSLSIFASRCLRIGTKPRSRSLCERKVIQLECSVEQEQPGQPIYSHTPSLLHLQMSLDISVAPHSSLTYIFIYIYHYHPPFIKPILQPPTLSPKLNQDNLSMDGARACCCCSSDHGTKTICALFSQSIPFTPFHSRHHRHRVVQ